MTDALMIVAVIVIFLAVFTNLFEMGFVLLAMWIEKRHAK